MARILSRTNATSPLMVGSGIKTLFGGWRYDISGERLEANLPLFNMLNVRYFLGYIDPKIAPILSLKKVASLDLDVFESERVWPRAFFTDALVVYEMKGNSSTY